MLRERKMGGNCLKFHFLSTDWLENVEKKIGQMRKNRGKNRKTGKQDWYEPCNSAN